MSLPPPPQHLVKVQRVLKAAETLQAKNPFVAYCCRLYACQLCLNDKTSPKETRGFLLALMNVVEQNKKGLQGHEGLGNQTLEAAAVEQTARQLFSHADAQDRAGQATLKTANAFYVASGLFEVLSSYATDGQLDDELEQQRKYSAYKAKYIKECIRTGKTPIPGPVDADGNPLMDQDADAVEGSFPVPQQHEEPQAPASASSASSDASQSFGVAPQSHFTPMAPPTQFSQPMQPPPQQQQFGPPTLPQQPGYGYPPSGYGAPPPNASSPLPPYAQQPTPPMSANAFDPLSPQSMQPPRQELGRPAFPPSPVSPAAPPASQPPPLPTVAKPAPPKAHPAPVPAAHSAPQAKSSGSAAGVASNLETIEKASKACKFAMSALQYSDVKTAINYLEDALRTLKSA